MKCSNCGKEIRSGYFTETEEGMKYICTDCLLRYDKIRKRHRKYDVSEIYSMHMAGYSAKTLASYFKSNPLTISGIINDMERNL